MFRNIARKLRVLSYAVTILGVAFGLYLFVTSCLFGIWAGADQLRMFVQGLVVGALTALGGWLAGCLLYGFASLVADGREQTRLLGRIAPPEQAPPSERPAPPEEPRRLTDHAEPAMPLPAASPAPDAPAEWICPVCGAAVKEPFSVCSKCLYNRDSREYMKDVYGEGPRESE